MKSILALALFISCALTALAQPKMGYVNYNQLLLNAPGIKSVDQALQNFQDSLENVYLARKAQLEEKYAPLNQRAQEGLLAPKDVAQLKREYQSEAGNLQAFGTSLTNRIYQRRQLLLEPIIRMIDAALARVGSEGGYQYIFDSSLAGQGWFAEGKDLYQEVMDAMKSSD